MFYIYSLLSRYTRHWPLANAATNNLPFSFSQDVS